MTKSAGSGRPCPNDRPSRQTHGKSITLIPRSQLRTLIEMRVRQEIGCESAQVVIMWADDADGCNWTAELVGFPPARCHIALNDITTELRTRYQLARDRLPRADLAAILVNEALAELGLGFPTFPPPPRPLIKILPGDSPNWSAVPGGPVRIEYMDAFNRVLMRLQRHMDAFD